MSRNARHDPNAVGDVDDHRSSDRSLVDGPLTEKHLLLLQERTDLEILGAKRLGKPYEEFIYRKYKSLLAQSPRPTRCQYQSSCIQLTRKFPRAVFESMRLANQDVDAWEGVQLAAVPSSVATIQSLETALKVAKAETEESRGGTYCSRVQIQGASRRCQRAAGART
jgi:hypothetical protein